MFASLIIKAWQRLLALSGMDFASICLPVTNMYLQWLFQQSDAFVFALTDYTGQLTSHPPSHKLLHAHFNLISIPKRCHQPLQGLTVFTNGSGKTHKSVIVWWDDRSQQWESDVETVSESPQIVELAAVVRAFHNNPPIVRHFNTNTSFEASVKAPVLIRDPETGHGRGPEKRGA
ncbi:uncharacterized protein LOC141736479 isoform X2 [Larus michahellis]|uniref:uncharacterized protein LOC141736479 isoform X2 n=1 Tax=Larus michahellis TaxID=119627 RepID=UPI003D9BC084